MSDLLDAPARPTGVNYVGGAWVPSASGETYTKTNPMRPSEVVGEFSASGNADADAAVAAAAAAFPGWAVLSDGGARSLSDGGRGGARGARRGDRARHVDRDGQAAARSARRDRTRSADPALRRERGVPPGRRALRTGSHRRAGIDAPASDRGRRADHPVELPDRDPCLEARAGADLREHRRAEAGVRGAADRSPHRRGLRGGGLPAGRLEHRSQGAARRSALRSSGTRACERSRSPARSRQVTACATRRRRAASACSSSSAATTR